MTRAPRICALCVLLLSSASARAFDDCGTELEGVTEMYSNEEECAADPGCDERLDELNDYVADQGSICLNIIETGACSIFEEEAPESCDNATVVKPFDDTCTTITPGTITGEITSDDAVYAEGHADSYCINFTNGQNVTITTAASTGTGTPVQDTLLTPRDESDELVAQNDDANGYYSEINTTMSSTETYTIIVSGFNASELGLYTLTVTVN